MTITTCVGSMGMVLMLTGLAAAQAQYPARPVRLIVPFAAGGVNDTVARFVQPQWSAALGHPEVRKRFAATDLEARGSTPEQFGARVRAEIAKWAKVVRESGMRVE